MIRLVFHVLFLIVLAVLIFFNLSYRTTVNVFGSELENASVVVVMLLSFIAGALYALFAFFTYTVSRRRRAKQKGQMLENRQRTQFLDDREKGMDTRERGRQARQEGKRFPDKPDGIPDTP